MSSQNRGDIILSFAIFFQIVVSMFQELLFGANIITHEDFRNTAILICALPMVPAAYLFLKRRLILAATAYIIVISIICLTLIFYKENEDFLMSGAFYLLCMDVPCFLCAASIKDFTILKKIMLYLALIILVLGIIYLYLMWIGIISFVHYNMAFSYYLLFPALIFINQRKAIFTLFFLVTILLMFLLGSRGALFWSLLFWFILIFQESNYKDKFKFVLIGSILVVFSSNIISILIEIADNFNISSRTLNLMIEGNIAQDSNRFNLYKHIWEHLLYQPIYGYGIFGDRILLGAKSYCHNIALEILYDFGLLVGPILIFLLLFEVIRTFINSSNDDRNLFIILTFYCLVPLLVSSSYLAESKFGLFIGFIYSINDKFKNQVKQVKLI
jgi:hypothetical protein